MAEATAQRRTAVGGTCRERGAESLGESGSLASGERARRFVIEGRTLSFPALFQDGCSAAGLFFVPARRAQALIEASGFEVAELFPGWAGFSLACCHYRQSDCGEYNEVGFAFFVKPRHRRGSRIPYLGTWLDIARDRAATYVWKLPVTTQLANDAGVRMWGFPKTVEDIDFELGGGQATFRLRMNGIEVLTFSAPARGKRHRPPSASPVYTIYEGAPHVTYLQNEYHEMGIHLSGARLALGEHPLAGRLRSLGLPRRPFLTVWAGRFSFDVDAPQPL